MAAVFTCPPGSICSPQAKTPVGPNKTGIFHASATKVTTQGSNGEVTAAETVVYIIKNDTFQPAAISKDGGKTYAFSDPNYPLMTGVAGADLQNDLKNPQGAIRKNVDAGVSQSVDKAGLKAGDVIVSLNEKTNDINRSDLIELISQLRPADKVKMQILRDLKEKKNITVIAEDTTYQGYF